MKDIKYILQYNNIKYYVRDKHTISLFVKDYDVIHNKVYLDFYSDKWAALPPLYDMLLVDLPIQKILHI